jgi:hypothetical protein
VPQNRGRLKNSDGNKNRTICTEVSAEERFIRVKRPLFSDGESKLNEVAAIGYEPPGLMSGSLGVFMRG